MANQKPVYLAVALDRKGPTFRHKELETYKATRVKAPQALYDQIPLVKEIIKAFKIPMYEAEGFEADDILATIVKKLSGSDIEIFIATGDFDLFQLVSKKTSILYPSKGFKEAEVMRIDDFQKNYGLHPEQIPDYKAIAGDASDNIPGVKGIGPKGALFLLQKYGTLENIYEHLTEIDERMRIKLEKSRQNAFLSKKLTILGHEVPIDFDMEACRVKNFDIKAAGKIFEEFGFKSLLKRLPDSPQNENGQISMFG